MPLWARILIAIAIMLGLLILFIVIFLLNKKTKVPDDCPKDALPSGCASCMLSCGQREKDFTLKTEDKTDLHNGGEL